MLKLWLLMLAFVGTFGCGDFFEEPSNTEASQGGTKSSIGDFNSRAGGKNLELKAPITIAHLRDPASSQHQPPCKKDDQCAEVHLDNVVVSSWPYVVARDKRTKAPYLFGFFVVDPKNTDKDGRLIPYSGIEIVVAPGARGLIRDDYSFGKNGSGGFVDPKKVGFTGFPVPGDILSIQGQHGQYYGMPQLVRISYLEKKGDTKSNQKIEMPAPALFFGGEEADSGKRSSQELKGGRPGFEVHGRNYPKMEASESVSQWVGVLVSLKGVETTASCIDEPYPFLSPRQERDFGNFLVSGDVQIGSRFGSFFAGYWKNVKEVSQKTCSNTAQKCQDSRKLGQGFELLTGIVDLRYGVYRVNPREPDDIGPMDLFVEENSGNCQ